MDINNYVELFFMHEKNDKFARKILFKVRFNPDKRSVMSC
mgnify:CR=1 FL=1